MLIVKVIYQLEKFNTFINYNLYINEYFYFLIVNKRQNSFSNFENKVRNLYDQTFEKGESNGRSNIDAESTVARKHVSESQMLSILDRRHLEDVTNHQQEPIVSPQQRTREANNTLIIDDALTKMNPVR